MSNITEIIDEIPRILEYFISGFIFLKTLDFLNAKGDRDASLFTVWSGVCSFLIMSIVKALDELILPNCNLLPWSEITICVAFAAILAFVVYKAMNSKPLSQFLYENTRKSVNTDIWRDIIDYDKGTTFKVFLKNHGIIYIGKLIAHEEKGLDSWFVFSDYICTYVDSGKVFYSTEQEYPTTVAINLNEIERVELFYNKDTEIFN